MLEEAEPLRRKNHLQFSQPKPINGNSMPQDTMAAAGPTRSLATVTQSNLTMGRDLMCIDSPMCSISGARRSFPDAVPNMHPGLSKYFIAKLFMRGHLSVAG